MLLKILALFLSVTNTLAESIFEPHSFVLKGGRGKLHIGGQQWPLTVWVRETADVEGSLRGGSKYLLLLLCTAMVNVDVAVQHRITRGTAPAARRLLLNQSSLTDAKLLSHYCQSLISQTCTQHRLSLGGLYRRGKGKKRIKTCFADVDNRNTTRLSLLILYFFIKVCCKTYFNYGLHWLYDMKVWDSKPSLSRSSKTFKSLIL